MKRLILPATIVTISLLLALFFSACKKKSSDDSTTNPTPTCSDGILNQGETGIDCGGPCSPCPTNVCSGNGSNQYLPLAVNNKWVFYRQYYSSCPDNDTMTVEGTETLSGKTYYKVRKWSDCGGGQTYYDFRYDAATGNVYQYYSGSEFILIPGNPTVGQILANGGSFLSYNTVARKVTSVSSSVSTSSCTYSNVLAIQRYNSSTGYVYGTDYYVKGVGFVKDNYDFQLNSVQLY